MLVDSQRSGYSLESSLRQASNDQTASRQPGHSTNDDLLRSTHYDALRHHTRQSGSDSGLQNPPPPHVARIRAHPLGARGRLASTSEHPPGKLRLPP